MDLNTLLSPDTLWAMLPRTLDQLVRGIGDGARPPVDDDHDRPRSDVTRRHLAELPGASWRAGMVDGVAVLPVMGVVRPRTGGLWVESTNLRMLANDLEVAIKDRSVRAIILDIDSPGGLLVGTQEFADMVFDARKAKPITAYVTGMAASAGYWIASSASEVVMADTAEAGSIGVVTTYFDWSKFDEKLGVREIEIVSSQSPLKRARPTTETGRDAIQARVDHQADIFIDRVARNRGVSRDTVANEFGQGDLLVGERAVEAGLADRLGSLDQLIRELSSSHSMTAIGGIRMDPIDPTAITAEFIAEHFPEVAASLREQGLEAGRAGVLDEGIAQGRAEGAEQERERIHGIQAIATRPGLRQFVADLAWDPDMTPEKAKSAAFDKLQSGDLNAAELLADESEAAVRPDGLSGDSGQPSVDGNVMTIAGGVYAKRRELISGIHRK